MKLSKVYEPKEYESTIYELWEQSGAFKPLNRGDKKSFSIVVPPPNANGNLHLGHGLTLAIEDIATRYHRMKGEAALLLPGADHAGFETWVVYEKYLNSIGKTRFDYSREELYEQIWEFVDKNKNKYLSQFRKLGASVDWDHYTYTLDEKIVKRAYETFKKMLGEGLVYRAEKMVNFCTFHGTGFADIEVVYKEEKAKLYYIAFPLANREGELVVATARPETVVGQAALMVNPRDKRYKKLIGEIVTQPLVPDVPIKIIAEETIDPDFGTGVVTVTPGHALLDHEVAVKHDLPIIHLITPEGKMSQEVPEQFRGMAVKEAREAVAKELAKRGYMRKIEDYTHTVAHCYKCGTAIEPLLREQWFINVQPLAAKAIKVLKEGEISFRPAAKKDQLIKYLEGLQDWNISRQIAWGIPIPAFRNPDNEEWIYDERVTEEVIEVDGKKYVRDPDVFDTWFSSSSWPYATLDYPNGADYEKFYPLSLMETGADILYPWVSRMIMFGLYITGQIPFKEVYLHGLIQDEHGQKMSKSKGNVVDPMDKVDEFGSDAFRMGIIAGETAGSNRPFDPSKLVGARNFANKLWNIARFVEDTIGDKFELRNTPTAVSIADQWILRKLQQSTEKISKDLENYRFSEAYDTLYHTVWDDFADWYLEASKTKPNHGVLAYGLEIILKLAHPFAPFLTETIWQTLKWEKDSLLITSQWPKPLPGDSGPVKEFEAVKTLVSDARTIMTNLGLKKPVLYYSESRLPEAQAGLITRLAGLTDVLEGKPKQGLKLTSSKINAWLEVDLKTASEYLTKLEEKQTAEAMSMERLKSRLKNKSYVQNAPESLVNETRTQLEESARRLQQISASIDSFKASTDRP